MADYATLLRDRVTLTCRSVDRIFLQGYVPKLQTAGWVCRFLRDRRGFRVPSSAARGVLGDAFVRSVRRFAEASDIPVIHFKKGEDKEAGGRPGGAHRDRPGTVDGVAFVADPCSCCRRAAVDGPPAAEQHRQPFPLLA